MKKTKYNWRKYKNGKVIKRVKGAILKNDYDFIFSKVMICVSWVDDKLCGSISMGTDNHFTTWRIADFAAASSWTVAFFDNTLKILVKYLTLTSHLRHCELRIPLVIFVYTLIENTHKFFNFQRKYERTNHERWFKNITYNIYVNVIRKELCVCFNHKHLSFIDIIALVVLRKWTC